MRQDFQTDCRLPEAAALRALAAMFVRLAVTLTKVSEPAPNAGEGEESSVTVAML